MLGSPRDDFFSQLESQPELLTRFIQPILSRLNTEATGALNNKSRNIISSCLSILVSITASASLVQRFENFINSQLCVVYQLLESRIIIDFDGNILTIMLNLAKNSHTCPDSLVRATADLACFFRQMYTHGPLVCRIVSCLLSKPHINFEQEPEVSWMPVQLIDLAEKMILASKCETPGSAVMFEQECLGSAFIVGQLIIQVPATDPDLQKHADNERKVLR